jgi:two-component system, OmpR family, sensor histidine kinase MprB
LIARTALRPVGRLTTTAEKVAQTHDLSERLTVQRNDELGRLARAFNLMTSFEHRSPACVPTSKVLARSNGMPDEMRRRLLADVASQLEEMTVLVGDVVDLARGEEHDHDTEDVRLDLLVAKAVERAQRHQPHVAFTLGAEETTVRGAPARIDRAISNLLDNAAKWSPRNGTVEVTVTAGRRLGPRPRPWDQRRRPATRVRALLPRSGGARYSRLRPRPRHRPPGR